jgi:hypothetical protein
LCAAALGGHHALGPLAPPGLALALASLARSELRLARRTLGRCGTLYVERILAKLEAITRACAEAGPFKTRGAATATAVQVAGA